MSLWPVQEVVYPTSDGQPMAETDVHRDQMIDLIQVLEDRFADHPDVYVSGNILMFYEEGNNRKHRSPDVLVALGVEKKERLHYKVWEEGKAPDVVFEITSTSTRSEDLGEKKGLYAFLGVREYVIFDPLREYLHPRVRLYRNAGEEFLPVAGSPLALETLGLELVVMDDILRLKDASTGTILQTRLERTAGACQQADAERERADTERQRADTERQRADTERARAELAERELEQLRQRMDEAL